jgi:hypothetical protein
MQIERLVGLLCGIGFLAGVASAYGADKPYDFKGLQLGMSQSDFRKARYPDPRDTKGRVLCTKDKEGDAIALAALAISPAPSDDEAISGVRKCIFFGSIWKGSPESQLGLSMGGSNYVSYRHAFLFVPDPQDHVPKLYRIVLPTNIGAMKDVVDALTDKFGGPTDTSTGLVQNHLGAKFTQRTYTWTNSLSQIFIEGPWSKIDDMVVTYRLLSLDTFVNDQVQARKKAQKNRM